MNRLLKNLKWILLCFTFTLVLIIGIAIGIPLEDITQSKSISNTNFSNGCGEMVYLGEIIKLGPNLWKPVAESGEEIYCIEPGTRLPQPSLFSENPYKSNIEARVAEAKPGTGPSQCGCAPNVKFYNQKPKYYSKPCYECDGNHISGSPYDVIFIASWFPDGRIGSWDIAKQQAIWMSSLSKRPYNKAGTIGEVEGSTLYRYAQRYKTFYEKIMEGKVGMKPEWKTEIEESKVMVDQATKKYRIGPFMLDYVDGRFVEGHPWEDSWFSFSGISDMYLIDDEGKKLEIENFIIDGEVKKPSYFSNFDSAAGGIYNKNGIDWYAHEKTAPLPNQEFYVEFSYPKELVGSVKLHVDFKYLKCEAELCLREGRQYFVDQEHKSPGDTPYAHHIWAQDQDGQWYIESTHACHKCAGFYPKLGIDWNIQDAVVITWYDRTLVEESIETEFIPMTMKLGGNVFEDIRGGKDNVSDGIYAAPDQSLANIEVTLYEVGEGGGLSLPKLATLAEENIKNASAIDYKRRINPTITDENGYYEFRGLDVMKQYVVKFRYDGQTYLPTEYSPGGNANSNGSNATELEADRNTLTNRFTSIGSSPENYNTTNSLGVVGAKNKTYSKLELMGYKLSPEGVYQKTGTQLIDGYLYNQDGNITNVYTEGMISKLVKSYIDQNRSYPDLKTIYSQIAGGDIETWRKLQFIEDCKIDSYTKSHGAQSVGQFDTYPIYKQFTIYTNFKYPENTASDSYQDVTLAGVTYKNIYPGQLKINLGLWRRTEADIALKKDIYKAVLTINGRTEVYDYNERDVIDRAALKEIEKQYGRDSDEYQNYLLQAENKYWEIPVRVSDYNYYYNPTYSRELYPSERNYIGNKQLEAYVTYKITIRNQSQGILTIIDELVDYYDDTYEPALDKSWVMYKTNSADGNDAIRIKEQEYYDIMTGKKAVGDNIYKNVVSGSYDTKTGQYGKNTQFGEKFAKEGYGTIYVNGLKGKKLDIGETAYVYLTFKVKGSGPSLLIEKGRTEPGKQNIAEINGYSTFYADNTRLPNGVIKNSNDPSGSIDRDSNPGNFDTDALKNKAGLKYEHNFEDDTDRARGINIFVDENLVRKISGTIWEDKRTYQPAGTEAMVGNGVREKGEVTVSGIRVELHEVINGKTSNEIAKVWNGNQWVEAATTTGENGIYQFAGYIPGDYIVRFIYGGQYNAKYNGQDYKSTSYQINNINDTAIDQTGRTDISGENWPGYYGYTNYDTQNSSASYGYNIYRSDSYGSNLSDAKDIWYNRQNVINYSKDGVTNGKAQILDNNKVGNSNTQMVAETGAIRMEFEYNREVSEGNNNNNNNGYRDEGKQQPIDYKDNTNNKYHLENVDFGLEERPKAQLEINKKVSHVKITLANQTILFDNTQSVENLIWQPKTLYNINEMKTETVYDNIGPNSGSGAKHVYSDYTRYDDFRNAVMNRINTLVNGQKGLIQATMDEEFMHGTTIQITYDMRVTNIGEVDYNETNFYYTGKVKNKGTIVRTSADVVMDYVANNLQFRNNSNNDSWGWKTITKEQINSNNYVSGEVAKELKDFNTIITTEALNEKLIPLTQSTKNSQETYDETKLVLTQSITSQNKSDDLSYGNIVEIVKISNDVGRRMAYSVQGDQLPSQQPTQPDSSKAEQVIILPPFGEQYLYMGLGIIIAVLVGISIIAIKKTVLNNKRF